MFSYANRAIFTRFAINPTSCNILRQQSLKCLGKKEHSALKVFLRPYINNHASYTLSSFTKEKINILALDENNKEIGVVKFSRLQSLAMEKGMEVESVDQQAQPHPIYKLVAVKEFSQTENHKSTSKLQKKEKEKKVHTKLLRLKPTINQNDLKVKVCHVLEWLEKECIVNVKISIITGDKKHLNIYNEIVKKASNVASISKPITNEKEMSFELVSSASAEKTFDKPIEKDTGNSEKKIEKSVKKKCIAKDKSQTKAVEKIEVQKGKE